MSKSTHKNNASHALSGCYGIPCQAFVNINERLEQKPDIYRCTGSNSDRRGFYAVIQINLGTVLLRMVCRPSCRRSIMGSNTDSLYQIPVLTERYSLRRRKDPHYHGAQRQFIKTNRSFFIRTRRALKCPYFYLLFN